ncbi:MAG: thiamine-phosphate kinase [Gemmatimonadetes bacterium]|nr:thiamine-phosphate kinase [Gemmatimonadota bacterium]NNM04833.1 thiamine-phosphate kinase [Gemmatimonadota bacterium]
MELPDDVSGRIPMGPGGEFDLIRRLIGPGIELPSGVLVGSGDDCTVLDGGVVISTDLVVEGIHFRRDWITLEEVGYRAASAALSDVAAMAAEPLGILLSMALDPAGAREEAIFLQRGADEASRIEGVQILGGDLSRSPGPLMLNLVAVGRADAPVLRSGTEAGDEVWVTGWLGASAAAVSLWERGGTPPPTLKEAFARPRPRLREARWLAERCGIHGLIDLSDGLAGDCGHLASAAGLAIVLEVEDLPVHPALEEALGSQEESVQRALSGGEDYELCFSVSPGALDDWVDSFQDSFGIPLTQVGWAMEGSGVHLESAGRLAPASGERGFDHFSGEEKV